MLRGRQIVYKYGGFSQNLAGRNKLYPRQCVQRSLPQPVRSKTSLGEGLAFGILIFAMPAVELSSPELAYRARKATVSVNAFRSKLDLKRQLCGLLSYPLLDKKCGGGT
jgi:hypothetical protein